ncbi:ferritin-like domain-containing protein [Pelagicoccus sp. SDUM812002]|uniref:YciE/YciF ferroxidase family protein n=1 Tax=Pelagicoccus sp. SDUM812002 TaxID=3041266 RepID=UPI00280D8390|nr:ferritin-like domain-containing protein [Pelagicoccus sp. SDUM812002]MDQ8188430.1 ferritin-like domain-containing protein [Pelagicoccus sp. SDUM812002]
MENDLHKLFLDQLQDMYDAEHRIVEALPKKIEAAQDEELKKGLQHHLEETKTHVTRLEDVFASIDESPKRNTCEATKGLIKEAEELLSDFKGSAAGDAAIICAAQKIEHYEIATYGSLCAWADQMGHEKAKSLLGETLDEEKMADETLTSAAKKSANKEAKVTVS